MNKKTQIFLTVTLIIISQIMLAQPYRVTLRNETIDGTLLSNSTLSIYYTNGTVYESGIPSGSYRWLNSGTWRFGTDDQYVSAYKHQYWNSLNITNSKLRFNDAIGFSKTERAKFTTSTNATITINSNVSGTDEKVWFELRDPWWVENVGNQYQPNDFRSLEEMGIQSTHDVFENMTVSSTLPHYSIHTPELIASSSGIYQFQSWGTITGASTYPDPAHTSDSRYKGITITSSTVTINVNYSQVNNQAGTYTIPQGDRLIIPEGAVIACNPGFKLDVEGILDIRGTIDNPITLKSDSPTNNWHGIYVEPGYSNDPRLTVNMKYCSIEDADYGLDLSPQGCIRSKNLDHVVFTDFDQGGINYLWHYDQGGTVNMDVNITNCTFVNTSPSAFINISMDPDLGLGRAPDITNFIVSLENNIFVDGAVSLLGAGTVTEDYNDFHNSNYYTTIGSNSITSDPLFVDESNGDYHLQASSPCIDAGDPNSPQDPDFTTADMGVYYHDKVPAAPTNLTLTGNYGDALYLSWTASTDNDIQRYYIYRKQNSGGSYTTIGNTAGTHFTDTDVIIGPPMATWYYYVKAKDNVNQYSQPSDTVSTVGMLKPLVQSPLPTEYALGNNTPNPFNPTTAIPFDLPEDSDVQLVVYNLQGREVTRLTDGNLTAGSYRVRWDGKTITGTTVPSGVYLCVFSANALHSDDHFTAHRKLVLLK